MKTVYGWVVNWGDVTNSPELIQEPKITVDLFFTDRKTFEGLLGWKDMSNEILVPINVPDNFDNLDYIPDNY